MSRRDHLRARAICLLNGEVLRCPEWGDLERDPERIKVAAFDLLGLKPEYWDTLKTPYEEEPWLERLIAELETRQKRSQPIEGVEPHPTGPQVTHRRGQQFDSTPRFQNPGPRAINAAIRAIPDILDEMDNEDGEEVSDRAERVVNASRLVERLEKAGQKRGAAHWAIHELIRKNVLLATGYLVSGPGVIGRDRGWAMKPIVGRTIPNRDDYSTFVVRSTRTLWDLRQQDKGLPMNAGEGAERAGRAFAERVENDPEFRAEFDKFKADITAWHKSPEFQAWVERLREGIAQQNGELAERLLPPIGNLEAYKHLALMIGIGTDELDGMQGHEIVARAKAWADAEKVRAKYLASALQEANGSQSKPAPLAQGPEPAMPQAKTDHGSKRKRSTERGEGREKLIAALTKHHRYSDGSCLHLEPVANNELARQAGVSRSTASEFFEKVFAGHTKYRALCRDAGRLADSLKALNGEFSPQDLHLYGRRPAGEDNREEE
jgi:hypothetical protein